MEERDKLIELMIANQVTDAKLYNSFVQQSPMLANLMMRKFKLFLDDAYFTDIERQTMLMKFLEEHIGSDAITEVIEHAQNSELKSDYATILMEWMFHNSESIIDKSLACVDGVGLCAKLPKQTTLQALPELTDELLDEILKITKQVQINKEGE